MHVLFHLVCKGPDVSDSAKEAIKSPWRLLQVHTLPSQITSPQGLILRILAFKSCPHAQPGLYSGLNPKWSLQYLHWIPALTPYTPQPSPWHPNPLSQQFADPNLNPLSDLIPTCPIRVLPRGPGTHMMGLHTCCSATPCSLDSSLETVPPPV